MERMDLRLLISAYSIAISLPSIQAVNPEDLNDLTPELMTPVFNLMRTTGERMRDETTSGWDLREGVTIQQYLLVAIMSREEVEEVSSSGRFPDAFFRKVRGGDNYTRVMHRVLFALNQDRSRHTEVAVIDLGYLDNAIGRFNEENQHAEYPLIVMYSHYIPCAGVPKLGYSCAQEIKNYAIHRHEDRGFIVAFTKLFPNTNTTCSRGFLREGGVSLFQYENGQYVRIENFRAPPVAENNGTLQKFLYDEFIGTIAVMPHNFCMGNTENKEKIVAFFVNEMTYRCTYNRHKARGVTQHGQSQLYKCMSPFLTETLGNDCSKCKVRYKNPIIDRLDKALCAALAKAANKLIPAGRPPSSNDLSVYNPTWEPFDGPWRDLYSEAPSRQEHALPHVECADPKLSKISLCTRFKAGSVAFRPLGDQVQFRHDGVQLPEQPQAPAEVQGAQRGLVRDRLPS